MATLTNEELKDENRCPNSNTLALQDKSQPSSPDSFEREFLLDSSASSEEDEDVSSPPPSPTATRSDAHNVLKMVDTHEKKYGLDDVYAQQTLELRMKVRELQNARYAQHVNNKVIKHQASRSGTLSTPTSRDAIRSRFESSLAR